MGTIRATGRTAQLIDFAASPQILDGRALSDSKFVTALMARVSFNNPTDHYIALVEVGVDEKGDPVFEAQTVTSLGKYNPNCDSCGSLKHGSPCPLLKRGKLPPLKKRPSIFEPPPVMVKHQRRFVELKGGGGGGGGPCEASQASSHSSGDKESSDEDKEPDTKEEFPEGLYEDEEDEFEVEETVFDEVPVDRKEESFKKKTKAARSKAEDAARKVEAAMQAALKLK